MGYELHVTRASDWLDAEEHPVPEAEWLALVARDPELRRDMESHYDRRGPNGTIVRLHPVEWLGDPSGETVFWYDKGEITTKNPTDDAIAKLKSIAVALSASLFGDDGEEY
jgi:hypothetical protein